MFVEEVVDEVCPILFEPIAHGEEIPLLSGHLCDVRGLALKIKKPDLKITSWVNGIALQNVFKNKCDQNFYLTTNWIKDNAQNPLTGVPLTDIEKRAVVAKLYIMNEGVYGVKDVDKHTPVVFCLSKEEILYASNRIAGSPKRSSQALITSLHDSLRAHRFSDRRYWITNELAAYVVYLMAPQLVAVDPIAFNASQDACLSVVYRLVSDLMKHCLVFDVRNEALFSLFKALPQDQQRSFFVLILDLQKEILTDTQLERFRLRGMSSVQSQLLLCATNDALVEKLTQHLYITSPHSTVSSELAGDGFDDSSSFFADDRAMEYK